MYQTLKGLLKLTRINEYYGNTLVVTIFGAIVTQKLFSLWDLFWLFLANLLMMAFAFAINDIEDAKDDAKDPAKVNRNPVSAGLVKLAPAWIFTILLALLAIVILSFYGVPVIILGVFCLILGFLYSYKKIRLKSMPVIDLVSHGLFLGTIQFLIPATTIGNHPSGPLIVSALMVFAISVMGDLNNEIRDHKVDRKTNIRNTASIINITKIGNLLHWLYLVPIFILIAILSLVMPTNQRIIALALTVFFGLLYLVVPKSLKLSIVNVYAQVVTASTGIVALIISRL